MKTHILVFLAIGLGVLLTISSCDIFDPVTIEESYFPLDYGYQWIYQEHITIADGNHSTGEFWTDEYWDTIAVSVSSVSVPSEGWKNYHIRGEPFMDIGSTAKVHGDEIVVFDGLDTIPIIPDSSFTGNANIRIGYSADTLKLCLETGEAGADLYYNDVSRLQSVGAIYQSHGWLSGVYYRYADTTYRLLYFIKDTDTVWRTDD